MPRDLNLIHPELRRTAQLMPRFSFHRRNLWLIRWLSNLQRKTKIPDDVQIDHTSIPGQDGAYNIRLRIYTPQTMVAPAPVLVWMHGGGYIIGKPELDDFCLIPFARELGIKVVSIDYRLAPEHPFPTPLDDCYTALKWVHDHAQALGIDPARMAVGGESAGGGLAAALAQMAHDREEVQLVFQMLVYPMLDDRTCLRADWPDKALMTWSPESNRFGWGAYLNRPAGSDTAPAYSVPARREALTGLPPAWVGVGTLDLFYDEDAAYAQRLTRSGVDCAFVEVPGAFHGFDFYDHETQVVSAFRQSQIAALKKHLSA